MGEVYVALIHHPVYNKEREVVTTSITPLDLHDIARSCVTFGVRRCYIVNPLPVQRQVARRMAAYWLSGFGGRYNRTRQEAFELVSLAETLEDVERDIALEGAPPLMVGTTARERPDAIPYDVLAERMETSDAGFLILFGTGWGMTDELLGRCMYVLEPIRGRGPYNHLSVRGAAAIILDRLRGRQAPARETAAARGRSRRGTASRVPQSEQSNTIS